MLITTQVLLIRIKEFGSEIMKYLSTHLRYPVVAREMPVEAEITGHMVTRVTM